jgi:hypothetical protein
MVKVVHICLFLVNISACGGGGGGSGVVAPPQYGAIDGYVYAPVGSGAREAKTAPAGMKPVQGASVVVACGSVRKDTSTIASGYFKITSLPSGTCSLTVSYIGFNNYQTSVAVKPDSTTAVGGSTGIALSPISSGSIMVYANVSGGTVFIDGQSTGIAIPAGLSYAFDGIAAGEHTVSILQTGYDAVTEQILTVISGQRETVTFSLNPAGNQAPDANAGDDFKGFAGTKYIYEGWNGSEYVYTPADITISLDGTASADPNGDMLSYQWAQTNGPVVSLINPNSATASFVPIQEGTYEFSLKVNDGFLQSASDTVVIDIAKLSGKLVFGCSYKSTAYAELCTMDADGGNLFHLTENETGERDGHWSPDGTKIAYSTGPTGPDSFMALINSDGTGQTTTSMQYGPSDWFDNNEVLKYKYYSGSLDYYKVNINGSNEQRLTFTNTSGLFAEISPDGTKIAFAKNYGGDNYEIVVMNSDGSNILRLTNNTTTETGFAWLDDNRIIYETHNYIGDRTRGIFVMNADGTNVAEIPMPAGLTDIKGNITASSDGQFIFLSDQNNYLHVMYSDGSASMSYGLGGSNPDYHPGP